MQELANSLQTNEAIIGENEGFRSKIYKDTRGNNTVGFGFNIDDPSVSGLIDVNVLTGKRDMTWEEGIDVRRTLARRAFTDARNFVGDEVLTNMTMQQRNAITDMAYNMGRTKLGTFENMRAAIQKGDFEQASLEMLDSNYAKQVPSRALRNANLIKGR